jgi:hypothetical protein
VDFDDDREDGLFVDEQNDEVRGVLGGNNFGEISRFHADFGVLRQLHAERFAQKVGASSGRLRNKRNSAS